MKQQKDNALNSKYFKNITIFLEVDIERVGQIAHTERSLEVNQLTLSHFLTMPSDKGACISHLSRTHS